MHYQKRTPLFHVVSMVPAHPYTLIEPVHARASPESCEVLQPNGTFDYHHILSTSPFPNPFNSDSKHFALTTCGNPLIVSINHAPQTPIGVQRTDRTQSIDLVVFASTGLKGLSRISQSTEITISYLAIINMNRRET